MHVHIAGLHADVAVLVAGLLRRPVYVKVAGGGRDRETSALKIVAGLTRYVGLRRAARVQAPSEDIANNVLRLGVSRDRVVRIPNGLDTVRWVRASEEDKVAARRELGLPADAVMVLFVGRFAHQKGLPDLLEAWADTPQLQDAMLVLVGAPSRDDPIEPIAANERVIVRDWTNDIKRYYHASDILVLPSIAEGLPNTLLEAMACGLPVVATRVGGTPSLIRDGDNGLLVDPGDRLGLGTAISALVVDSGLRERFGHAAASTVRENYDIESVVSAIECSYRQITDSAA